MRWFLFLTLISGCTARAAESRTLTSAQLPAASITMGGAWESNPWTETDWIDYPGKVTLVVPHTLGFRPATVLVYLAFDKSGVGAALLSGDIVRIVEVTATTVTIRNDTKGDYFARIVLQ